MLPLLVLGESAALESALPLPLLAAEPLSLRLGGDEVHRVFRAHFVPTSALAGQGKPSLVRSESSGSLLLKFASHGDASSGSRLRVRGSGFIMLHAGSILPHCSSRASVLKITLKCVFSEGVMLRIFGSDLSFLFTWISGKQNIKTQISRFADTVKL